MAVRCIAATLKPSRRFVAEFGGKGNIQALLEGVAAAGIEWGLDLRNPWFFPGVPEYTTILEAHGLETRAAFLFDRLTPLDDHADALRGWIEMFGPAWITAVPADLRQQFLRRVEELLRPTLLREGRWWMDYRRLRVVAVRKE